MGLRRRLIAGSAWSTSGTIFNQLIGFAVIVIVARHVGASEFGTVAIVLVTIELSRELVTAGLPDYLIRNKTWDDELASSALLFQTCVASALAGGMATAGFIVEMSDHSALGLVLLALAPTYILDGAASVFSARMYRQLRFRALVSWGCVANAVAGLTAILAALNGAGLWALVLNRGVASASGLVLIAGAAGWVPRLRFTSALWDTLRRSWRLAAANMLGSINLRVTDFVVGGLAGPALLGTYQIAGKGLELVLGAVVVPSQRVALSGFAMIESIQQIGDAVARVLRLSSLAAFPVFVGLSALAPEFVRIAFGPDWTAAVAPMRLLTLVGAPALLTYLLAPVLTAVDRPRWLIRFASLMALLSAGVAAFTSGIGVTAIAVGFLVRSLIGGGIAMFTLDRVLRLPWTAVVKALAPAATASVAMFIAVMCARHLADGLSLYPRTGALVLVGAAAYGVFMLLCWPRALRAAVQEFAH